VEDAIAATEWSAANLARLGGDATKLAVGGDSAGGNLAAITAVHCRDTGIKLAAQFLLYPATDLSARGDSDVYVPYLGPNFREKVRDPRVSPFFTPTLSGVAPAIIGTGAYDFLYQDNLAYAEKLRADGVPLVLRDYPNLNHGFFSFVTISEVSRKAADELCGDLRVALHP
jgi:acetyl esterase